MRPRSASIAEYLRLIRCLSRFYRFDTRGARCGLGRRVRFFGSLQVHLGDRSALLNDVTVMGEGVFRLGAGSTIGDGSFVCAHELVEIGRDVMVAGRCYVIDTDHGIALGAGPIRDQPIVTSPVRIGDDVWIGAHVVIRRGVTIGDGAVVGANSTVTRDIPPNAIAVGSPARVVRYRV